MYNFLWNLRFFFIAFGAAGAITMIPLYAGSPLQDVVLAIGLLAFTVGVILQFLGREEDVD